jgi:hypothetical protein
MEPWLTVSLFGLAVFGLAWLAPGRAREDHAGGGDSAYDRLLEELETENRELLEAVARFKQEQDETVKGLVRQIAELERKFREAEARTAASKAEESRADGAEGVAGKAADSSGDAGSSAPASLGLEIPADKAIAGSGPAVFEGETESPATQAAATEEKAASASASIRARYAGLLALHAKGKSVEQIAKSVGMNKGEVQLILHLAKREAEQLA